MACRRAAQACRERGARPGGLRSPGHCAAAASPWGVHDRPLHCSLATHLKGGSVVQRPIRRWQPPRRQVLCRDGPQPACLLQRGACGHGAIALAPREVPPSSGRWQQAIWVPAERNRQRGQSQQCSNTRQPLGASLLHRAGCSGFASGSRAPRQLLTTGQRLHVWVTIGSKRAAAPPRAAALTRQHPPRAQRQPRRRHRWQQPAARRRACQQPRTGRLHHVIIR